ncbi:DUF222 domain-containing protein [Microbacterium sp. NPDC055903]
MTNRTVEPLDRAMNALREVLSGEVVARLSEADRAQTLAMVGQVLRLSEAIIAEAVAAAEPGFEHALGCRSENELLRRALRVDSAQAARFGKAARAVRRDVALSTGERMPARWPALRAALLDGEIGVSGLLAATGPLEEVHHRIGTQERLLADADLAGYARGGDGADAGAGADSGADVDAAADAVAAPAALPEDLKQAAYEWAMALDPDGAGPVDRSAQRKRSFTIGPLREGLHQAQGDLLPEVAAQLQLIFDAYNNPKVGGATPPGVAFAEVGGEVGGVGDAVVVGDDGGGEPWEESKDERRFNSDRRGVIDPRTAAQKRHDALAAALGIAARHEDMPRLGGAAPTLVVHVDARDYAAGAGWASVAGSQAPVPISVAAHTACAGGIQRVLFDEGRIVGIGVSDRIFTAHQRRAIAMRDKECLIPGCHVPASWCEIHHVAEHRYGGPTHTDNGVPLCWWHHRNLSSAEWEIRMRCGLPEIRGPAWWDPERRWRTPARSRPVAVPARA